MRYILGNRVVGVLFLLVYFATLGWVVWYGTGHRDPWFDVWGLAVVFLAIGIGTLGLAALDPRWRK